MMGYSMVPRNKGLDEFRIGAFSWPILVEHAFGTMFPYIRNSQWYCVFGIDERMPFGDTYPRIISNDGFRVTSAESKMMAQMTRNLVAIQRSLPDSHMGQGVVNRPQGVTREQLIEMLGSQPEETPWPMKIRSDFVDRFEQFADWAEKSGGFRIW